MSREGKRAAGVYYEEHGSGDDVIVWLHGYACSAENWDGIVPAFPDRHNYVFDMPGHGESIDVDCDGTIPGFAAPVVAALDELGVERFTVVGYSAGGQVGMRIAIDHPDRVKQLVGVVPWYASGGDADDPTLTAMVDIYGNRDAVREVIEGMAVTEPPIYGQLLEDELRVPEKVWKSFYGHGGTLSQFDELADVRVPVTYVLGIEDVVVDVHKALADVKAVPGARAVVLSGVGHLCAWEASEVVVRELGPILASATPAAA
jgi:pimeloyl-ACP methyl ester carboxylesterase